MQQVILMSRTATGRSTASTTRVSATGSSGRATGRCTAALHANRIAPCIIIVITVIIIVIA